MTRLCRALKGVVCLLLALSAAGLAVCEASRACAQARTDGLSPFTPVRLMVRMND